MLSISIQNLITSVSYRNPRQTKTELLNVMKHYRSLHAKVEYFSFNDGVRKKLIVLKGTIPIKYKGSYYNIPLSFWLLDTHPANAPICYVNPTNSMSIKVSRNVDSSGKIYLPYLHEWNQNRSDLLSLIQICIITFSESSPVYAKSPFSGGEGSQPVDPVFSSLLEQQHPSSSNSTIPTLHLLNSVRSAVQDKLNVALREEFEIKGCELQSLRKMRDELNSGKVSIETAITESKRNTDALEKNVEDLEGKLKELEEANEKLEGEKEKDLDEALVGTAPLYNQLFHTFAKEASIDDAIYYLGEGLRRGVIDCDSFLKNVRKLSRQQFELRSLMIKCREKAGLRV
uniref:Tumor susceptibility gene 101 protein n=1 Tax=Caligus clemensi TaxID=344056 RepID=C1C280_CALCM|nr:Tumor susceptibility gene 101 protein [Caligus clemensi]